MTRLSLEKQQNYVILTDDKNVHPIRWSDVFSLEYHEAFTFKVYLDFIITMILFK